MSEITNDLIYEVLKDLQQRQGNAEKSLREVQVTQTRIRGEIHSVQGDIHNLQGDVLRLGERIENVEHRLDRIEKRLSLVKA